MKVSEITFFESMLFKLVYFLYLNYLGPHYQRYLDAEHFVPVQVISSCPFQFIFLLLIGTSGSEVLLNEFFP